jgi:hypothetical protein
VESLVRIDTVEQPQGSGNIEPLELVMVLQLEDNTWKYHDLKLMTQETWEKESTKCSLNKSTVREPT